MHRGTERALAGRAARRRRVAAGALALAGVLAGVSTWAWVAGPPHALDAVVAARGTATSSAPRGPSTTVSLPVPAFPPGPTPTARPSVATRTATTPAVPPAATTTGPAATPRKAAPGPATPPAVAAQPRPAGGTTRLAYLTGYTWWDNTPPGSPQ